LLLDDVEQFLRLNRLRQISVHPSRQAPSLIAFHRMCGHRDDRETGPGRPLFTKRGTLNPSMSGIWRPSVVGQTPIPRRPEWRALRSVAGDTTVWPRLWSRRGRPADSRGCLDEGIRPGWRASRSEWRVTSNGRSLSADSRPSATDCVPQSDRLIGFGNTGDSSARHRAASPGWPG
jgi:hypothetical protein